MLKRYWTTCINS